MQTNDNTKEIIEEVEEEEIDSNEDEREDKAQKHIGHKRALKEDDLDTNEMIVSNVFHNKKICNYGRRYMK